MLMYFIGRLVAKMGSNFLLEMLMEVPDDTELQMVVVGVGTAGFVVLHHDGGYALGNAAHRRSDWRLEEHCGRWLHRSMDGW